MTMTNKSIRDYINLIQNIQEGVAEDLTKLPSGDYQNSHTGVRSSKPPAKKKRGEKTWAEWDAIEKAKKEQGVSEGYDDEAHPIRDDGNEGRPGKQRYPGKLPNKEQGVAEEQLEETSPEAIDKINQITRK